MGTEVSVGESTAGKEPLRWAFLAGGALSAMSLIALLALALERGGDAAVLLLDYQEAGRAGFPFPFTIQTVMLVLLCVALGDLAQRWTSALAEARARGAGLLPEDDHSVVVAADLPELRRAVIRAARAGPSFLGSLVDECLIFFHANRAAASTHQILTSLVDLELHRLDLRYSLVRYVVWALPTIGFIGTVVGIARALANLQLGAAAESMASSLEPVVGHLAMAFNTTILALLYSAVLVLVLQIVQKREESAINASASYCLRNLINRLHVPVDGRSAGPGA